MAQKLETGLVIKGLTGDTNTLLVSGSSVDDVFVVKDSGNIGIGTMVPTEKLEVSGKTKTESIQITSGATTIGSVLTAKDSIGNSEWVYFTGITSISGSSPISATTGNNPVISIADAKADGSTKGATTFTASDFNDDGSGLISIDYANGQSASGGTKGFLTSSDWNTFNNKQNAITLTTTGSTGAATFDSTSGALNVPLYGGSTGSAFGYSLMFGFGNTAGQVIASGRTYSFGDNFTSTAIIISGTSATADRPSRRISVNKRGTVTYANVMVQFGNGSTYATPTGSTMQILVHNVTTSASSVIDSAFLIGGGADPASYGWYSRTSPTVIFPSINKLYTLSSGLAVNQGDQIQIRFITPAWTANPSQIIMYVTLFIE
jgi:hypothetical protein